MSAKIVRLGPRRFQGYCEDCQDGVNGSLLVTTAWRAQHNAEKHPTEKKETA